MKCPFCHSSKFRNSRFRMSDLGHALLLRFPVRCRDCEERIYVSLLEYVQVRRASKLRHASHKAQSASQTPNERHG